MPTRGTLVLQSEDTNTPDVPVPAHVYLTPQDFDLPFCTHTPKCPRRPFTPEEFGRPFNKSARTIEREIEDGALRGVRVRGGYVIPWVEMVNYLLRQQGAMN